MSNEPPIHRVTSTLRYHKERCTYNDIVASPAVVGPATFTDHNVSSACKLNVKARYLPLTE